MILGITTAPRPGGERYLSKTIGSAYSAGFCRMVISAEPVTDVGEFPECSEFVSCDCFRNDKVLGNYGNFKALAEKLLLLCDDDDVIVTAEDDIEFCADAAKKIINFMQPFLAGREKSKDFGFFAAFSSSCHQGHLQPNSIAPLKTTSLWGACSLVWTKESLQALLDHRIFKEWRGLDDNRYSIGDPRIKHVDTCISKVMDKLDRKMYFCRPSLVKHIGVASSLRKKAWTPDRNCNEFEE